MSSRIANVLYRIGLVLALPLLTHCPATKKPGTGKGGANTILAITSPASHTTVVSTTAYTGTCTADLQVTYGAGASGPATVTCSNDGAFTFAAEFSGSAGDRTLTISQSTTLGVISIVTYKGDPTPAAVAPVIEITSPAENTVVGFTPAPITGNCDNGLAVTITYPKDASGPASVTCTNGTFSVPVTFSGSNGTRSLTFSQTNLAGMTTSIEFVLGFDTTLPAIAITVPADNASFNTYETTVSGTCEAGLTVTATYGSMISGPATTSCAAGVYSFSILFANTSISGGTITLAQTNALGNRSSVTRTVYFTPPAFNIAKQFNGNIYAIVPLSSGDVYVGGGFTSYNQTNMNYIARLHADGTLDGSYDIGTGFNGPVYALESDGATGLYVGGDFTTYNGTNCGRLAHLLEDGTLDTSFNVGTGANAEVRALSRSSSEGVLYVGGAFTQINGSQAGGVARLSFSGVPDTVFATGFGTGIAAGTGTAEVFALTAAAGGVLIGGNFNTIKNVAAAYLAHLNSDGTLDGAFTPTINGIVYSVLYDGSSAYYVGGAFAKGITKLASNNGSVAGGYAVPGSGFDGTVYSLSSGATGAVYAAGSFTKYDTNASPYIVRFSAGGVYDAGFAVAGGLDATAYAIAYTADGSKEVVAGGAFDVYTSKGLNHFVRLSNVGALSSGAHPGTGADGSVYVISPIADSTRKVYIGGAFHYYNGYWTLGLARINPDGSYDTGFNVGTGFDDAVYSILQLNDGSGKIYVGGAFTQYNGTPANRIIRLNSDGTIDTDFATGTGFNNNTVAAIAFAPDNSGNIYVGGSFTSYKGTPLGFLVRLTSAGAIDNTFNVGFTLGSGFDLRVRALLPLTDGSGRLYVAGDFSSYNGVAIPRLVRLTSTAALDNTFHSGNGFDSTVRVLLAKPGTNSFYVAGDFSSYNGYAVSRMVLISDTGAIDTSFHCSGVNGAIYGISISPAAGSPLYVVGQFTNFNYSSNGNRIAKISATGNLDSTLNLGSGLNGDAYSVAAFPDASGSVLVGGAFNSYIGTTTDHLVRLSITGTLQ